eukprot:7877-Pelagococcus_subviridis.AAC.2
MPDDGFRFLADDGVPIFVGVANGDPDDDSPGFRVPVGSVHSDTRTTSYSNSSCARVNASSSSVTDASAAAPAFAPSLTCRVKSESDTSGPHSVDTHACMYQSDRAASASGGNKSRVNRASSARSSTSPRVGFCLSADEGDPVDPPRTIPAAAATADRRDGCDACDQSCDSARALFCTHGSKYGNGSAGARGVVTAARDAATAIASIASLIGSAIAAASASAAAASAARTASSCASDVSSNASSRDARTSTESSNLSHAASTVSFRLLRAHNPFPLPPPSWEFTDERAESGGFGRDRRASLARRTAAPDDFSDAKSANIPNSRGEGGARRSVKLFEVVETPSDGPLPPLLLPSFPPLSLSSSFNSARICLSASSASTTDASRRASSSPPKK